MSNRKGVGSIGSHPILWVVTSVLMLVIGACGGVIIDRIPREWSYNTYLSSRPGGLNGHESHEFLSWGWDGDSTFDEVRTRLEPIADEFVAGYTQTPDGQTRRSIVASINHRAIREHIIITFQDDETIDQLSQQLTGSSARQRMLTIRFCD